jgi:hypothetical protein
MRLRLTVATLLVAALACNTLLPPRPALEWDASPEAVVIQATFCCGFVPMEVAVNYIPDATVWGDGRIVWVLQSAGGGRQVLEGRLSADEMRALLGQFVDAGFFGWDDSYANYNVTDLASQCLTVSLTGEHKTVCEYYEGAPRAFHTLYDYVSGGAGAVGADYVPERGYVTAYPLTEFDPAGLQVWPWPAEAAGFSLAEAGGGRWVEGEALQTAWTAVNGSFWGHALQDGDSYYRLTVQVPGLSQSAPPEE